MARFCPFIRGDCVREECRLWVYAMGYEGCALLILALKGLKREEP